MGLFDIFRKSKKIEPKKPTQKVRVIELSDPIYFRTNMTGNINDYIVCRLDKLIFTDCIDGFKRYQIGCDVPSWDHTDGNSRFMYLMDGKCDAYYAELSNDKSDLLSVRDVFNYEFVYKGQRCIYYLDGSTDLRGKFFYDRDFRLNVFMNKDGFSNSFSIKGVYNVAGGNLFLDDGEANSALEELKVNVLNEKLNKI